MPGLYRRGRRAVSLPTIRDPQRASPCLPPGPAQGGRGPDQWPPADAAFAATTLRMSGTSNVAPTNATMTARKASA